jgi:hypothetical protein
MYEYDIKFDSFLKCAPCFDPEEAERSYASGSNCGAVLETGFDVSR